jgi:hypothetical protein
MDELHAYCSIPSFSNLRYCQSTILSARSSDLHSSTVALQLFNSNTLTYSRSAPAFNISPSQSDTRISPLLLPSSPNPQIFHALARMHHHETVAHLLGAMGALNLHCNDTTSTPFTNRNKGTQTH